MTRGYLETISFAFSASERSFVDHPSSVIYHKMLNNWDQCISKQHFREDES